MHLKWSVTVPLLLNDWLKNVLDWGGLVNRRGANIEFKPIPKKETSSHSTTSASELSLVEYGLPCDSGKLHLNGTAL